MKLFVDLSKAETPKRLTKSPLERLQKAMEGYDYTGEGSLAEHYQVWCEANELEHNGFSKDTDLSKLKLYDFYTLKDDEHYSLEGTGLVGVVDLGKAFILTGLPDFEITDEIVKSIYLSKAMNKGKLVQRMVDVHRADGTIVRRMQWVDPSDDHSPHGHPHVAVTSKTVARMHINRYGKGEPDQGFERYLQHNGVDDNAIENTSRDNPLILPMTNDLTEEFMEQMAMVHPEWQMIAEEEWGAHERLSPEEQQRIENNLRNGDFSHEPRVLYPGDEGWVDPYADVMGEKDWNKEEHTQSDESVDDLLARREAIQASRDAGDDFYDDTDDDDLIADFENDFDDTVEPRRTPDWMEDKPEPNKGDVRPYEVEEDWAGRQMHTVFNMTEFADKVGRVTPQNYINPQAANEMTWAQYNPSEGDYTPPTPLLDAYVPSQFQKQIPESEMPRSLQEKLNGELSLDKLMGVDGQDPVISASKDYNRLAQFPNKIATLYQLTGGLTREAWSQVLTHPDRITFRTHPADVRMTYDASLGGTVTISATVRDRYNRPVAHTRRSFYMSNPHTLELHNDYLEVDEIAKGRGIADTLYQRMENIATQLGNRGSFRTAVTIQANISIGKYAWAKEDKGFGFANTYDRDTMRDMLKRFCDQQDIDMDEMLLHNMYSHVDELDEPYQFRDLKWHHTFDTTGEGMDDTKAPLGKAFLTTTADAWNAVKWLGKDANHLNAKHLALLVKKDEYDYDDIDHYADLAGFEPKPVAPLPEFMDKMSDNVLNQLGITRPRSED